MTKKEYLIKLLTALDCKWPMAAGLKLLVEHNILSDQTIDALQHIFAESIKFVNNQESLKSLEKSQVFLQKLRNKELQDQE
jgi:hypothetical protein